MPLAPSDAAHWQGHLALELARNSRQTFVSKQLHVGPLRLQRAFYPEGHPCHLYLLHPPGGVVGGDGLHLHVRGLAHSHGLMTQPGATKLYRSDGRIAEINQQFHLENGATFEWLPQETIAFSGARVRTNTAFYLKTDARLAAWEILCLGRPVGGEIFANGAIDSRLAVYCDGKPLLLERLRIDAEQPRALARLGDFSVVSTFLLWPADAAMRDLTREFLNNASGATLLDALLVVRALHATTAETLELFRHLWQKLRPYHLERSASVPRVWRV